MHSKPEPRLGPASSSSLTSQMSSHVSSPVPHSCSHTTLPDLGHSKHAPAQVLRISWSLSLEGSPSRFLHYAPSPPPSLHSNLTFSISPSLSTVHLFSFKSSPKDMFFKFILDREEGREKEKEKETLIGCLPYTSQLGIETAA